MKGQFSKRVICVILIISILLVSLTSCFSADGNDETATETKNSNSTIVVDNVVI